MSDIVSPENAGSISIQPELWVPGRAEPGAAGRLAIAAQIFPEQGSIDSTIVFGFMLRANVLNIHGDGEAFYPTNSEFGFGGMMALYGDPKAAETDLGVVHSAPNFCGHDSGILMVGSGVDKERFDDQYVLKVRQTQEEPGGPRSFRVLEGAHDGQIESVVHHNNTLVEQGIIPAIVLESSHEGESRVLALRMMSKAALEQIAADTEEHRLRWADDSGGVVTHANGVADARLSVTGIQQTDPGFKPGLVVHVDGGDQAPKDNPRCTGGESGNQLGCFDLGGRRDFKEFKEAEARRVESAERQGRTRGLGLEPRKKRRFTGKKQ